MNEQREGVVVAALAGICLFVALAHVLAYIMGRLGWVC